MTIKNKKRRLIVIVLLVALAAFGTWWLFIRNNSNQQSVQTQDTTTDDTAINYNPPTEEESQRGDDKKQEVDTSESTQTTQPSSTSQKKSVTPTITGNEVYGSNLEVSGYVHGIVEKGGTCTAVVTKGSSVIKQQKAALDDAQYTSCGVILIPKTKLASGTWKVVLEYESAKYKGSSTVSEVVVQ